MKYYKNILKYLIAVWIMSGIGFCVEFTIDLVLLNTSQFTLSNWNTLEELWSVEVNSDADTIYKLRFTLKNGPTDLVEGTTHPLSIASGTSTTYTNLDPVLNTDALSDYWEDADFISNIESLGYLPPGNYTLNIEAFDLQDNLLSSDEEEMEIPLGDQFSIDYPNDGQIINGASELYFQWSTPGFRSGIIIQFRLIISAIVLGDVDNANDAINMGSNSVYYYNSNWEELPIGFEWPYTETGISRQLNTFYSPLISQTSMEDLVCGYDYAWRIDARECFDNNCNDGIWGWPEPELSNVRQFTWGNKPTGLTSPDGFSVLPLFIWAPIFCADAWNGYEIEIKKYEDAFDENETFLSGTAEYHYQSTDPGLIPSQTYKWRVRVDSDGHDLPWSEVEEFTVENLSNPQPQGLINSVLPQFDVEGPTDIASYQIIIASDPEFNDIVYDGEDLGKQVNLPWTFQPEDPFNGVFPNTPYYYKIKLLDGWNNQLDLIGFEDNVIKGNFAINPVYLEYPTNESINMPLNLIFTWDGPSSVPKYLFEITDDTEDIDFSSPQFYLSISGTSFDYPDDGDYPLDYAKTYYWRVLPMDFTDNTGPATSYPQEFQFTTKAYGEVMNPLDGSIQETVRPYFEINTPVIVSSLTLQISDENDEDLQNPVIYNNEDDPLEPTGNSVYWQFPNQDIDFGLHPGSKYYWQYLMYSSNGDLIELIDGHKILEFLIVVTELITPEQGAENIPLNYTFTWDGPDDVPEYEFWISDEEDPELQAPVLTVDGITAESYEYPENSEFPLEYDKTYYWRVVSKDINGNLGLQSSYPNIFQFTTSPYPEIGEEVSVSNTDLRIPIINITITEGLEYTILIYSDSDGSSIVDELTEITNFPYEYLQGTEKLEWATTYYIQVQPYKDGEVFGPPSNIMPFSVPAEPENQLEVSIEIGYGLEILVTILVGIGDATDYSIFLSSSEDMTGSNEFNITSSESQYIISSENLEWGQNYYLQVTAYSDGVMVGLPSDIQMVNIESEPGANEQTAISVNLLEGSVTPNFEIINEVTGATGYQIIISTESDMSAEFWQFNLMNSTTSDYSSDGPILLYGQSYYVTAQALKGDITHGNISNIVGFFIPNITPPILGDAFNWETSIPPADQYILEVSLVEDFSVIVISKTIQGITSPVNMVELEYSKGYYWRVSGLDGGGESFGNPSQVKFFETEPVPSPTLNVFSGEVSLTPEFTWQGIEISAAYQIKVGTDGDMENVIWQENISSTSTVYPESAILLNYATTYYWQIIALDEDDNPLSQSSIETFSTQSIYPVIGLNPDGGTETLMPILQWEANDNFSSYLVILASDPEMSNILMNEITDGNSIQTAEGLLSQNENYYWSVDGLDENGESLAESSNIATLVMPSANSIELLYPSNGEQLGNLTPVFKWTALLGASSYSIQIGMGPEFESSILNLIVSGTELSLSDENKLENSKSYFWQIQGANEDAIILSPTETFSTSESSVINIQSLEDGESISVSNPIFSWEAGEGIAAFIIRFSENSDLSESWKFQIGATNFEYPEEPSLNFETPYYWQVSPLDNEGNTMGDWTSTRNFSISAAFIVELELPGNGETATTSNPVFQWSAVESAAKYEIQVSSNEDFTEIIWSSEEIVENNTAYPSSGAEPLNYGQVYYWHVRALGEENPMGDFSQAFSFDISGENKVILEGPLSEISESLLPYFSWDPINGASGYTLTLASDESLSTLIYTGDVTEVFLQYPNAAPPLNNGIQYFWNVSAKDGNGNQIGDKSDIGSFNTPDGTIEIEFMFGD